MPRITTAVLALAFLGAISCSTGFPGVASAGSYHYGFDNDDKDKERFGWALVRDGHNSSSDLGSEDMDEIKDRYGDTFLYIRDGDERWVIRDRGLMRRAEGSLKPIEEAGREIGHAVGAKVGYSMSRTHGSREKARVARQISRLDSRIARLSERGEDTEQLERDRQELQEKLEELKNDRRQRHDDEEREAELDAATERASRHMREATRKLNKDLRDILREAKSRHLADSVED